VISSIFKEFEIHSDTHTRVYSPACINMMYLQLQRTVTHVGKYQKIIATALRHVATEHILSHTSCMFACIWDHDVSEYENGSIFMTFGCILQHTATHCNALQHTAIHCNALQHTATHCNTLQHSATQCNTVQHSATRSHKHTENGYSSIT